MIDGYIDAFTTLDKTQLMSKEEVIEYLRENGEHEPSLARISDRYFELFNIDPIWRYPFPDESHNGAFFVPVREGYLYLPYNEIDSEYYELLLPEKSSLLDAENCEYLIQTMRDYTNDLLKVLAAIHQSEIHGAHDTGK